MVQLACDRRRHRHEPLWRLWPSLAGDALSSAIRLHWEEAVFPTRAALAGFGLAFAAFAILSGGLLIGLPVLVIVGVVVLRTPPSPADRPSRPSVGAVGRRRPGPRGGLLRRHGGGRGRVLGDGVVLDHRPADGRTVGAGHRAGPRRRHPPHPAEPERPRLNRGAGRPPRRAVRHLVSTAMVGGRRGVVLVLVVAVVAALGPPGSAPAPVGGGRAGAVHRSRLRRGHGDQGPGVRLGARLRGQGHPGARPRHLRAGRRHPRQAAGGGAGLRRRLLLRRQGAAGQPGHRVRQAGLRGRLDHLPAGRGRPA